MATGTAFAADGCHERGGVDANWYEHICDITINPLTDNSLGNFFEMIGQLDEAIGAYEHALRASPRSIPAMNAISSILRTQENFPKAVEYLNQILSLDQANGDCWGSLGRSCSSDIWRTSY